MEINEKKLEKILKEQRKEYQYSLNIVLKEQREEFQRYLGVCVEDFESKVEVVAEQYLDIKKTLESHTKILDSHTETISLIKVDVENIKETLDSHTETIGSIKVDVEIIKTDIEFIKSGFKKKVDLEEFEVLEKRVIRLEKLLSLTFFRKKVKDLQFQKAV